MNPIINSVYPFLVKGFENMSGKRWHFYVDNAFPDANIYAFYYEEKRCIKQEKFEVEFLPEDVNNSDELSRKVCERIEKWLYEYPAYNPNFGHYFPNDLLIICSFPSISRSQSGSVYASLIEYNLKLQKKLLGIEDPEEEKPTPTPPSEGDDEQEETETPVIKEDEDLSINEDEQESSKFVLLSGSDKFEILDDGSIKYVFN